MGGFRRVVAGISAAIRKHMSTCAKCKRPYPADPDECTDWLAHNFQGRAFQVICPECQTPEQVAEREIRLATESYTLTDKGRIVQQPKVFDDDDDAGGR